MMLFETGMGVAEYVHVHSEDDLRRIYAKFQEKRNNTGWSCTAALHQYSTEYSTTDAEHHADVAACMAEPNSSTKEPKPTYEQLEAKIVLLEGWLAERRKEVDRLYQEGRSPRGVIEMLQQELRDERGNVASLQRRLWDDGTYIRKLKKEIAEHREKAVPTFGAPIAGMTFPFTIDTPHRDTVELTVTGVDITDGVHRVHMTADIRLPEAQPQEVPSPVGEVRDVPGVVTQLSLDLDVKTTNPDAPPFVDFHTYTASKMFGVSFKEVTADMRNEAKTASFRDAFRNELDVPTATDPTPPHDKGFLVYDDATTAVDPGAPAEDTASSFEYRRITRVFSVGSDLPVWEAPTPTTGFTPPAVGAYTLSVDAKGNTVGRSQDHSNLLAYEQAGAMPDNAPKPTASAADTTEPAKAAAPLTDGLGGKQHPGLEADDECPNCGTGTLEDQEDRLACRGECGQFFAKRPSTTPSTTLTFGGVTIGVDGDMLFLTDMWKAAGSNLSKTPAEWRRQDGTKAFIEYLETMGQAHSLVKTTEGRNGGTWAHWQLGMAYAKYLSPKFHAWCNSVVRAHMLGRVPPAAPSSVEPKSTMDWHKYSMEMHKQAIEVHQQHMEREKEWYATTHLLEVKNSKTVALLKAENDGLAEVVTAQYNELTEYKDFLDGGDTGVSTVALNMGYNEQFLFSLMREHGLIVSGRTAGWSYALQTDPYKEYIDKGWFVVRPNLPYRWKHPFTGKWGVKQSSTTLITNLGWFNLHKMYGEHGTHWNKSKPTHLFPISPCNRKVTAEELDNYRRKLWAMWTKEALTQGMHYADIPPYPTQKDEDE